MEDLTSGATFFSKRVFPTLWFGFLGFFFVEHSWQVANGTSQWSWSGVTGIAALGLVGLGIMSAWFFDLADHVYDAGDHLIVQRGKREVRISFADIVSVSETYLMNPPRITLRLRKPGALGREVAFSPRFPMPWSPFRDGPIAKDLKDKVKAAQPR